MFFVTLRRVQRCFYSGTPVHRYKQSTRRTNAGIDRAAVGASGEQDPDKNLRKTSSSRCQTLLLHCEYFLVLVGSPLAHESCENCIESLSLLCIIWSRWRVMSSGILCKNSPIGVTCGQGCMPTKAAITLGGYILVAPLPKQRYLPTILLR